MLRFLTMFLCGCIVAGAADGNLRRTDQPDLATRLGLDQPLERRLKPALVDVPDVPGLPRVLLIGDSISIAYTREVRAALAGRANVHRPDENCGPTAYALARLDVWLGGAHWDVIHFNFGLHDLKYLDAAGNYVPVGSGRIVATPEEYARNLRMIVTRLQRTGAKLIFATTTPVPEGAASRAAGSEAAYNAAAFAVMKETGVAIDDLHACIAPRRAELQNPHDVHFKPEGDALLAAQVAATIRTALPR